MIPIVYGRSVLRTNIPQRAAWEHRLNRDELVITNPINTVDDSLRDGELDCNFDDCMTDEGKLVGTNPVIRCDICSKFEHSEHRGTTNEQLQFYKCRF